MAYIIIQGSATMSERIVQIGQLLLKQIAAIRTHRFIVNQEKDIFIPLYAIRNVPV